MGVGKFSESRRTGCRGGSGPTPDGQFNKADTQGARQAGEVAGRGVRASEQAKDMGIEAGRSSCLSWAPWRHLPPHPLAPLAPTPLRPTIRLHLGRLFSLHLTRASSPRCASLLAT
eukprot:scaffold186691_cov28-Tisochrysis_lutea.AAC.5